MRVMIATDFYVLCWDNRLFCGSAFCDILKRYKNAFENIVLCTRVKKTDTKPEKLLDITEYVEKLINVGSLANAFLNKMDIEEETKNCDMVVARVPSIIAYRAAEAAKRLGKPYFTESMGCAWDAYWNHGIVGKAIAPYMFYKMKSLVKNADFALYVTEKYLQNKYPCKNQSVHASNVKINIDDNDVMLHRTDLIKGFSKKTVSMMTAAAIDVRYKGQEYVIKSIPKLNRMGIKVKYYLAGQGSREYLESVARSCNVSEQVVFLGTLSHDEVLNQMDNVDIYIQPSLQEGLPRSMIEAMSRGMPCLGARTAGIPELIDDECVFRRKSPSAIAQAVKNLAQSNMADYVERNFEKAKEYDGSILDARREAYYDYVKETIKE